MRYGMLIDLAKCTGCGACVIACKMENGTPMGAYWAKVLTTEEGTYPTAKKRVLPVGCQHCENAPCVRVCPTGASHHDENGTVQIDQDKCIGCRMCMGACPYNARSFNWASQEGNPYFAGQGLTPFEKVHAGEHPAGVVEKCIFCKPRVQEGKEPACVHTCITSSRLFGDLDDESGELRRRIRELKARPLLEEDGTKPSVYYAGLD